MEINVQRVESTNSNAVVANLVEQLVGMEPGHYSVGKDTQGEVNKFRSALREHNFRSQSRKVGVGGQRVATKGANAGQTVDVIHYELVVEVTAPAGQAEPTLPPEAPRVRKPKAESTESTDTNDVDAETAAEVENTERKRNR